MGWIHDRHMQRGGSIGGNPDKARRTNRYPLRKISFVIRHAVSMFDQDFVRFECGHEGSAWGTTRARCKQCPPREPT